MASLVATGLDPAHPVGWCSQGALCHRGDPRPTENGSSHQLSPRAGCGPIPMALGEAMLAASSGRSAHGWRRFPHADAHVLPLHHTGDEHSPPGSLSQLSCPRCRPNSAPSPRKWPPRTASRPADSKGSVRTQRAPEPTLGRRAPCTVRAGLPPPICALIPGPYSPGPLAAACRAARWLLWAGAAGTAGSRRGRFAGCVLQEGAESSYFLPKCQLPAQPGSAVLRLLPSTTCTAQLGAQGWHPCPHPSHLPTAGRSLDPCG